jgi:ParB family chromosome partitioning protein
MKGVRYIEMSETINNEANREEDSGIKREKVRVVPHKYVDEFPNHPFRVKDDDEMQKLVESIREYGVLSPVIARRKPDDR